ncbi:MAG: aldo/keto reductase [Proteobacteria bacterium]|nr:aldo/keto reductase [Pseudomonadota bacterium]
MKTREFGRTGLRVSELVFGGGFVGGILVHADDETKLKALRRALQAGINWIDTAPLYGQGKSERALGWLLKEVEETPYLSTKVQLDTGDLSDIPGQIERSVAASLERLQRDSVDLLQLHNPIYAETGGGTAVASGAAIGIDEVLRKDGVADRLERMRDQGLTRFIGLTALGEAGAVCEAIGSGRFDSAQVYYNMINASAARGLPAGYSGHDFTGVIEACRAVGASVMNIRVLAAGVLATDARHGREVVITRGSEIPLEEKRAHAVFERLGTEYGTRAQTALRFGLANPDVACVIFGLAELSHLEEALGAAEMGPLPQEALDELNSLYAAEFGAL